MRNLKRALSLLLTSAMALGMVVMGSSAVGYQDVDDSNTHQEAIEVLQAVGIMSGVDKDNFDPDGSITRNQMAVVMAHLLNLDYDYYRGTNPFTDVPEWAAPYVAACAAEGVVAGIGNGQYGGDQKVTAAQASLMIMKALGYFQNQEDFGEDWQIATIRQASYIDLFSNIDSNAESALTRGQVAQLVLNGLTSDMVDFTGDKGVQIGDVTVGYHAEYTSKTSSAAKYNSLVGGKTDIAQQGQYYIQLGEELYNGKLTMSADTDVFQRPATTWTYNSDTIGTYVNYDLMVGQYTTSASGKELYNMVGKTAFDKYDFAAYVNGEKSDMWKNIAKNNDATVAPTDNGALTQVFVNNDTEDVVVTVINTYLAQATADYNEKKDTANFDIYGLTGEKGTVSGDDFDVADIKADDFVLVTYADDAIQSISDVNTLSEVEISKFSTNGTATTVTVGGTKYDSSATLAYDTDVLDSYVDHNLKDTTYNVYLDQYGYVIGVDIVEAPSKYLFVTGTDDAGSNLSTKTWSANAIFLDGTSKVIDVEDGKDTFTNDGAIINKWYKYTVDNDGVYTLTKVQDTKEILDNTSTDKAAQKNDVKTTDIDAKHISLDAISGSHKVYGNENSIYLLAELDLVKNDGNEYVVIKGADEVATGVDNVAYEVYTSKNAADEVVYNNTSDSSDAASYGVYTLYGEDGYVIAAVVVGESDGIAKNVAYAIDDSVSSESYNSTTKMWTWTRDVIINGEEVELTETSDKNASVLKDKMAEGNWYTVKYDADGNVKDVVLFDDANDYQTTIAAAVAQITADNDFIVAQVNDSNTKHAYTLKGNTLYDETTGKLGFLVSSDVKIALSQEVNNKTVLTYDQGSTTLKAILEDLNENGTKYEFNAVIEDGRATSVIIIDNGKGGAVVGPDGEADPNKVTVVVEDTTIYTARTADATSVDEAQAIENALTKLGYTDVQATAENGKITEVSAKQGTLTVKFSVNPVSDSTVAASDSAALDKAIEDGKSKIILGSGTYTVTKTINSDVTIVGNGDTVITKAGGNAIDVARGTGVDVTIEDVTIKGVTGKYGVNANGSTGDLVLKNVTFEGGKIGVQADGMANVTIENCTFKNCTKAAISLGDGITGTITLNNNSYTMPVGAVAAIEYKAPALDPADFKGNDVDKLGDMVKPIA